MEYSEDIFDRYPQLSSIAETLETQCELAKEKHTEGDSLSSAYKNECHSFQVTKKLLKKGHPWQPALRPVIQGGEEEFDAELSKVLIDCPIGIEITVKDKDGKVVFNKVPIKTNPEEAKKATIEKKDRDTTLKGIENIEIMMLKLEHEREKDQLLRNIERLEETIEDLEEENADLNGVLDEKDKTLGEVAEKYKELDQKKVNPPLVTMLGAVVKNVVAGIAVSYPRILDGLNLGEENKAALIKQITEDLNGTAKPETEHKEIEASYEAVNNASDLEGKSDDFKKIYGEVTAFVKTLSDEEANIVYVLLCLMITDSKFDTEKAKKILGVMQEFEAKADVTEK